MICPADKTEMNPVITISHYGQPIYLDQCEQCGGIWFDESELFRAKQGEAEKIEALNTDALKSLSMIKDAELTCPRDKTELLQFTDKYFPKDIILERCPLCKGIWLNRGLFTKYQGFRQELKHRKEKSPEDKELEERIAQLLMQEAYRSESFVETTETLKRLGNFLNAPVDSEDGVGYPTNIILTILGTFLPFKIPFPFK